MPIINTRGAASAKAFGFTSGAGGGLYAFTSFTFRTTNLRGYIGPTLAQCLAFYDTATYPWLNSTSFFNTTTSGIQVWTVPATGGYRILAQAPNGLGDSGTLGAGGSGARITVDITLTEGEKIYILCGQPGNPSPSNTSAAGSGGTFVVRVPAAYLTNPESGLSSVTNTQVICVAGAGARYQNGYQYTSHPSGVTQEGGASNRVIGGGRSSVTGGSGPNGAAGMYYPAFITTSDPNNAFIKTWNAYDDPSSYSSGATGNAYAIAYPFVRGGYGSFGYNSSSYSSANSGGFGGGGGQNTQNSYSCGSGGWIGGYETDSATSSYNQRTYATNNATCGGAGGSFINGSAAGFIQTVTNSVSSESYGFVVVTKL